MKPFRFAFALLLLLAPSLAFAEPPKLTIPAEVKTYDAKTKLNLRFVQITPETDAVSVLYVSLDGVEPIPAAWSNDAKSFRTDTLGLPDGRYKFIAVAANEKGEQARVDFVLVKGSPPPPVPPKPPKPVDPVVPVNPAAKAAVAGLTGYKTQATALANFYRDFKAAVEKTTVLKTTGQFRSAYTSALRSFVEAAEYKGAPMIGAQVDAFIASVLGPPLDVPLDAATKAKIVVMFGDLEVALREVAR